MSKMNLLMTAAQNTEVKTPCIQGSGPHQWILVPATGNVPLLSKISILQSDSRTGTQFEGTAADHNRQQGTLNQSVHLSENSHKGEMVKWKCSICGFFRECDHVNVDSIGALTCVEVKCKRAMGSKDARQLGRNCQLLLQGAVHALAYKIPKGPQYNVFASQIRNVANSLGAQVQIIRV